MFELFDPKDDVRIDRGANLPHWFQPGVSYFVTFRTADSIPADVSRRWHSQRSTWLVEHGISMSEPNWRHSISKLSESLRREFHETFSQEYLNALDKGHGACVLRRAELNEIVAKCLRHFDGDRYHLGDFVIMPNHVHSIVCLLADTEIEAQCTSWKHYSALQINRVLNRGGRFWQEESFDHLIRSAEQFEAIQRYIANNPKALNRGEYFLHQPNIAGTTQVP